MGAVYGVPVPLIVAGGLVVLAGSNPNNRRGIAYPFSSANYGQRGEWWQSDRGQPLASGRGLNQMANEIFKRPASASVHRWKP
jgi:hypothetical protein